MKVVVTGGAGFIGSHVADAFLERGNEVLVVDDLSSGVKHTPDQAKFVELDIADTGGLQKAFADFKPDFVAHLAAQASVTVSVADPQRDFASNVLGTFNVVRSASELGARVVSTSTGGVIYGNDAPIPTPETYLPAPVSPYGASKLAAESYVSTWSRSHDMAHVTLRPANIYGPRQSPHGEAGAVAIFSDRLLRGERPVVYGYGELTRDYLHVSDLVRAFTLLADKDVAGTFNVGWGREVSVLELLESLQRAAGTSVEPQLEPIRPGEHERGAVDSTAAREAFGWEPEVELDTGLADTFRWYAETHGP
ncbi:MAG: SDR family NAD(P)-dependent oxidoreductase [Actinomycetota bacterium]|nr:SDR family NAD(P)-dependent oxidoreductase [Actinomycetota bacterium]